MAVQANTEIGESPSWDDRAGVLRFVDAHPGTIYRYDPADGSLTSCTVGQAVGAVVVREAGGIAVAVRDGIGLVDESTGALDLIAPIELDAPRNRMNDAKCDPAGRLSAGTMAVDLTLHAGWLSRILPDRSVTRVVTEITCSNGLGLGSEGDRMYYIDTFAGGVDVFDFEVETGEVSNRRQARERHAKRGCTGRSRRRQRGAHLGRGLRRCLRPGGTPRTGGLGYQLEKPGRAADERCFRRRRPR